MNYLILIHLFNFKKKKEGERDHGQKNSSYPHPIPKALANPVSITPPHLAPDAQRVARPAPDTALEGTGPTVPVLALSRLVKPDKLVS